MKEYRVGKIFPKIYFGLLVAAIAILIYTIFGLGIDRYSKKDVNYIQSFNNWKIYDEEDNYIGDYTEFSGTEKNETIILKSIFPEDVRYDCALGFYTSHYDVTVYAEGEKIYEFKADENNRIGHTAGYQINMLPDMYEYQGRELQIELSSPYWIRVLPEFYIGNMFSIYLQQIYPSMFSFMISFITLTVGLVICGCWMFFKDRIGTYFLYLGLFSINTAIYNINEQKMANFLFRDYLFPAYLSFISLMLLPISFIYFVKSLHKDSEAKIWYVLLGVNYVNIIVSLTLQILNIKDLREMLVCTHICAVLMFVVFAVQMIREAILYKISRTMKLNIVCILVVVACLMVDVVNYYISDGMMSGSTANLAFLIYIIVVGINAVYENRQLIEKGRKASMYEKMAYTDKLTGVSNRMAHEQALEMADVKKHKYIVCMFDLNNLKKCNDTLGHNVGDEYIKSSSDIIKQAFGKMAEDNIFRIGGDEFCVILKDKGEEEYQKAIDEMVKGMEAYNKTADGLQISIAYGYAVYDSNLDASLKETRSRADSMMYEKKFLMKQGQQEDRVSKEQR
ncbi:MAG: GGDEF domain-containing protein [Lachnospiraceae bacterium]|nr:GGDEF domain-containing protein [Lachnospiraceae bacterium]